VREKFRQVQPLLPIVLRPITWQQDVINRLADTRLRRTLSRVSDDIGESLRAGGAWVGEHVEDMTAFVGERLRVRQTDMLDVAQTQQREQSRKDRQAAKQQRAERRATNPPEGSLQKNALLIFLNLKAIEVEFDKVGWQRFNYDALNPDGRADPAKVERHLEAAEAEHRGRIEPIIRMLRELSVMAERVEKEWTEDKAIPREFRDQAARVSDVAYEFANVLMRSGERFTTIFGLLTGSESATHLGSVTPGNDGTQFAATYKSITERFASKLDALFPPRLYRSIIYNHLQAVDGSTDPKQKGRLAADAVKALDAFLSDDGDKALAKAKDNKVALGTALRELRELRTQIHALE
jgi:hypothetical protein